MKSARTHIFILALALVSSRVVAADEETRSPSEREALAVLDEFMAAFNAGDTQRWADTLHYPHVRIAGGKVTVSSDADEYAGRFDFDDFRRRTGWHHSAWDEKQVVQSSDDKVHVTVRFTRYRSDGSKIASYRSLYIVTLQESRWGVQARSSFAP